MSCSELIIPISSMIIPISRGMPDAFARHVEGALDKLLADVSPGANTDDATLLVLKRLS